MPEVRIEKLGRQGDGIFSENGRDVYVPFTLEDETVEITGKGMRRELISVIKPSTLRIDPICKHFGACGGCQVQHMKHNHYEAWKSDLLHDALQKNGIQHPAIRFMSFPANARRKAVFSVNRDGGILNFGFIRQNSNDVVSVEECPVLSTPLQNCLPNLSTFAASLPLGAKPTRISVLATNNGPDVHIEDLQIKSETQQRALSHKALELGFARLSLGDETLIEANKPTLQMGKALVIPPPGAFVQASAEVETAMAELVSSHLSGSKKVADLYSGIGTFTLRLAEHAQVWALEDSAPAIAALDKAWRNTAGSLKQVTAEVRNLERRPVSFKEFKKIDGLVFDPPRSGAELQSRQIAKSKVGKVAAVSCNPTTLARDLAILLDGGFQIQEIVAFDQFRFTHHLETVVLLEK